MVFELFSDFFTGVYDFDRNKAHLVGTTFTALRVALSLSLFSDHNLHHKLIYFININIYEREISVDNCSHIPICAMRRICATVDQRIFTFLIFSCKKFLRILNRS